MIVTAGNIGIAYPLVSYYPLKDLLTLPPINKHPKINHSKDKKGNWGAKLFYLPEKNTRLISLILAQGLTPLPNR
jgi:hypothetical protein